VPKPKPVSPPKLPPPPPPPPVRAPGTPILPGRPIAERLEAWTEGDELVGKLARVGEDIERERDALWARREELRRQFFGTVKIKKASERKKESERLDAEIQAIDAQWLDLNRSKAERVQAEVLDILAAPNRLGVNLRINPGDGIDTADMGDDLRVQVTRAEAWLDRVVGNSGRSHESKIEVGVSQIHAKSPDQRAQYSQSHRGMDLAASDIDHTVAHEAGHGIEYNIPGLQALAHEYIARRIPSAEVPIRFVDLFPTMGFRPDEVGRKGDFDKYFVAHQAYYVGKVYSQGSTELISMGIEHLYGNPAEFARRDPELVKFLIGVLRGDLR
jgi:hypothetical protein